MNENPPFRETVRSRLGIIVVLWGIGVVTVFSIVALCVTQATETLEMTKTLLASVLPVLGTWVGTVLAYYFAKENFESAARTTKELVGIEERLRSVPVTTAMIPIEKADKKQLGATETPENLQLKELLKIMDTTHRNRLPVLSATGAAIYVIHRSSLTEFIAQRSLDAARHETLEELTIKDLKEKRVDLFRAITGWACVKRTATLAEAKKAMEDLLDCSDVFVTESGRPSEPVIGWITNVEISLQCMA
jgi:hypothetical protein